jgi:hypothetical protein
MNLELVQQVLIVFAFVLPASIIVGALIIADAIRQASRKHVDGTE